MRIRFFIIAAIVAFFLYRWYITQRAWRTAPQKPLVILIPSYNNQAWCIKNLDSVFGQNYHNFRVIYVDDCSTDDTYKRVRDHVAACGMTDRVTIIHNTKRMGALANIYHAVHTCCDDEIIVSLDGDDWFAHEHVLTVINQQYQDPNVWLTYGQYKEWPRDKKFGISRRIPSYIIRNNLFREFGYVTSQPRTYYARLFKKINKQDLLDHDGTFYAMTHDPAIMFPMLEMAGDRITFIPAILYVYNVRNPINDYKVNADVQHRIERDIKRKKKYQRLDSLLEDV